MCKQSLYLRSEWIGIRQVGICSVCCTICSIFVLVYVFFFVFFVFFFYIVYFVLLFLVRGRLSSLNRTAPQIPGLKEDYRSLNLHINIAGLVVEGSGSPDFRRRWQTERALLEGDDCCEVGPGRGFYGFFCWLLFSPRCIGWLCWACYFAHPTQQPHLFQCCMQRPAGCGLLILPRPAAVAPVTTAAAAADAFFCFCFVFFPFFWSVWRGGGGCCFMFPTYVCFPFCCTCDRYLVVWRVAAGLPLGRTRSARATRRSVLLSVCMCVHDKM